MKTLRDFLKKAPSSSDIDKKISELDAELKANQEDIGRLKANQKAVFLEGTESEIDCHQAETTRLRMASERLEIQLIGLRERLAAAESREARERLDGRLKESRAIYEDAETDTEKCMQLFEQAADCLARIEQARQAIRQINIELGDAGRHAERIPAPGSRTRPEVHLTGCPTQDLGHNVVLPARGRGYLWLGSARSPQIPD